jgi:hypothetical protein
MLIQSTGQRGATAQDLGFTSKSSEGSPSLLEPQSPCLGNGDQVYFRRMESHENPAQSHGWTIFPPGLLSLSTLTLGCVTVCPLAGASQDA